MNQLIQMITTQSNLTSQEAWWLLEHITQKKHEQLLLQAEITKQQHVALEQALDQITKHHKPLAYIIGFVPFLKLKVLVEPPVLIPRVETEAWVSQLIEKITPHAHNTKNILEIGTGSGAIALAVAQALPNALITATDINPHSLDLAWRNAQVNQISNVTFIQSDLFKNIQSQKFDLIISNPPYVPQSAKNSMSPSVMLWEDHTALFSGIDGLDFIRKIIAQVPDFLSHQPTLPFQLVLEIDHTQAESLKSITQPNWLLTISRDLFGKNRTAWLKKKMPL